LRYQGGKKDEMKISYFESLSLPPDHYHYYYHQKIRNRRGVIQTKEKKRKEKKERMDGSKQASKQASSHE
jgi:hypothetical protein